MKLSMRDAELQTIKIHIKNIDNPQKNHAKRDFLAELPASEKSDDVIRDIGRLASSMNMQVSSLLIAPKRISPRDVGNIQLNLTLTADYKSLKNWLSELLTRYPSIGVKTLSMRSLPADPFRQETQLVLILFTND